MCKGRLQINKTRCRCVSGSPARSSKYSAVWSGGQGRPPLRLIRSEMPRISYVKYSTGTNLTIRGIYRALRKPDSTVARRAFLDRRCNDNTHNRTTRLFARQRYFASPALFSPPSFLLREKRWCPRSDSCGRAMTATLWCNRRSVPRLRRGGRTAPARGVQHP